MSGNGWTRLRDIRLPHLLPFAFLAFIGTASQKSYLSGAHSKAAWPSFEPCRHFATQREMLPVIRKRA
jgi:hypothetical protein